MRNKKKSIGSRSAALPGSASSGKQSPTSKSGKNPTLWEFLNKPRNVGSEIGTRELTFVLKSLATLVENGVSLPKSLETLAEEKTLAKHRHLLESLRQDLENGETFSRSLGKHPSTFDTVMVNQIKVAERTGTIATTLRSIANHREKAGKLRKEIIGKLSYPILLITMGTGVIAFLMMFVVPVFQETYSDAGVPLPMVTVVLIFFGNLSRDYALYVLAGIGVAVFILKQMRNRPEMAYRMDSLILRLPLFGVFIRDIAVLQLMEVLGSLLDAGFTVAEALGESAQSVQNRAVRASAEQLQAAVNQGEKFSREIERKGDMFPPIVSQLVIVGEQTGKLANATRHIRSHLEEEIERKTNLMVGTLEPVLTISLAAAIGTILLAIYLPMFDMISTMG